MLFLNTLIRKQGATNAYGEDVVDLTSASFIYKNDVTIVASAVISDEFEMRPDLAARVYYGDSSKLDYILKFNGISNPFSFERGNIILIGDVKEMEQNFNTNTTSRDEDSKNADIREKFFDQARLSKKDQKRLELIKKKASQFENGSKSNLPPNFAETGTTEIKIKDGIVVFGPDVVGGTKDNGNSCPDSISRAKVKQKLLEKQIFRNI